MNPGGASPLPSSAWTKSASVSTLPMNTVNITGLRIWWRGMELAE